MHRLEMPDSLPAPGIEREQSVGEKISSVSCSAIEVGCCRAGRHENEAAHQIDRHSRPVVGAARGAPGISRPRLRPELSGARNSVKGPANLSGADVVRANVAWCRALTFADPRALDEDVLINNAAARLQNVGIADVATKSVAEVDRTGVTERTIRLAVGGVERVQAAAGGKKNSALIPVRPVRDAAIHVSRPL